jgi:hypothetical protein
VSEACPGEPPRARLLSGRPQAAGVCLRTSSTAFRIPVNAISHHDPHHAHRGPGSDPHRPRRHRGSAGLRRRSPDGVGGLSSQGPPLLAALETSLRTQASAVVTAVRADDCTFTGTIADNIRLANPAANEAEISGLLASMRLDTRPTPGRRRRPRPLRRREAPTTLRARPRHPARRPHHRRTHHRLDHATAIRVLAEIRRRLPHIVLILAIHKRPPGLTTDNAAALSLD